MEKVNSDTSERLKLAATSSEASRLLARRPNAGVPRASWRAKARGSRPSRAAASGICADSITQPLRAPRQDTAATMAMAIPAQPPHSIRAASAMGAVESFSCAAGTMPITAVTASTVAMPASRVPARVARGMVRAGSSMAPAGTVAASSPSSAHSTSATQAWVAVGSDSALRLNGWNCAGSMNQIAMPANSASGTNLSTVSTICIRPASRSPSRLIPAHSHSPASAQAPARSGVATSAGNSAPRLPAKATAMAALALQIDTQ